MNNYLQHIYSMRWALCAGCVDLYVYLVLKSAPKQVLDVSLSELDLLRKSDKCIKVPFPAGLAVASGI